MSCAAAGTVIHAAVLAVADQAGDLAHRELGELALDSFHLRQAILYVLVTGTTVPEEVMADIEQHARKRVEALRGQPARKEATGPEA